MPGAIVAVNEVKYRGQVVVVVNDVSEIGHDFAALVSWDSKIVIGSRIVQDVANDLVSEVAIIVSRIGRKKVKGSAREMATYPSSGRVSSHETSCCL